MLIEGSTHNNKRVNSLVSYSRVCSTHGRRSSGSGILRPIFTQTVCSNTRVMSSNNRSTPIISCSVYLNQLDKFSRHTHWGTLTINNDPLYRHLTHIRNINLKPTLGLRSLPPDSSPYYLVPETTVRLDTGSGTRPWVIDTLEPVQRKEEIEDRHSTLLLS